MQIVKNLIKYNYNKGGNSKKYIVVHDTGNTAVGANAENHYKYFNGGDRGSSAHYFVDDKVVMQLVEDNDRSWHCGKKYGNSSRPEVNNNNSIGVEICINADGNYSKACDSSAELIKYLMKKYNIKDIDVVRHYDACLKTCPSSMSKDNWKKWGEFRGKLVEDSSDNTKCEVVKSVMAIDGKEKEVSTIVKDGNNYVRLRDLESDKIKIGYDVVRKMATVTVK